jgi:hypothetical protein
VSVRFCTFAGRPHVSDELFSLCEQKSTLTDAHDARVRKRTSAPSSSVPAVDVRRRWHAPESPTGAIAALEA